MSTRMRFARFLLTLLPLVALPTQAALTPATVSSLVPAWHLPLGAGVTGALAVANGLVYAPALDTSLYALDPTTGARRWVFKADNVMFGGVLPTAGGNVCFGDANATVYCVRGDTGVEVWRRSLGRPGFDTVWSAPATANGRLFVSIASLQDQPCTKGRLVALDLATGNDLWTLQTVPDKICSTDTGIACTDDAQCGGGTCVDARGAGVTASVTLDPTGNFVYMNTVGCFTFPSIGDSDSIFKLDAATGAVLWKNRVTPPEQFGFCANDTAVECSTDAHCMAVGGRCTNPKPAYHDFGFLNGPLRLEVPADGGGTRTLIVSGSKNGTLYAFHEADGTIAWTNEIQPIPVSPGFAGFGLFNAPLTYAEGRLYAALYQLIPARVCDNNHAKGCTTDAVCGGGRCLPAPDHLMAFDPRDGTVVWSDDIGPSWSSVAVVNGVAYTGTQVKDGETNESDFFAYDAATGTRLATLRLPGPAVARAVVVGDTLIVGYGVSPPGGVQAFTLPDPTRCRNGQLDPGETCDETVPGADTCCTSCAPVSASTPCAADDGNECTVAQCSGTGRCEQEVSPGAVCSANDGNQCTAARCDTSGACVQVPTSGPCDDGDSCTTPDACGEGTCTGVVVPLAYVNCVLDQLANRPCGDEAVPAAVARKIAKRTAAARRSISKAAQLGSTGAAKKLAKLRRSASKQLDAITALAASAARATKAERRITAGCQTAIGSLTGRGKGIVTGASF